MSTVIVGAGLAGLIAACHFPDAAIFDAAPGPGASHQALLRFRTTDVAALTGIPFKQVTVTKNIYSGGKFAESCSIRDANNYAYKVSGGVTGRSITNLAPVQRFIAPDDFYDQLVARHAGRINWGTSFSREWLDNSPAATVISTAPMSVNLAAAGIDHGADFPFSKSDISVTRVKLRCPSDVYQTIYFPDPNTNLFRASITGDTLIIEVLGKENGRNSYYHETLETVLFAFGLFESQLDLATVSRTTQPFGKIVDMPKADREALMHELTNAHNIYSLGRFATWRNILLDDVVSDLGRIERLIGASAYTRSLIRSE